MKRVLIAAGVVVVLAAVVLASVFRSRGEDGAEVYSETVERRDIVRLVKASGEIDPRVKVKISAHVIGRIERLFVEEGQVIEQGQPFLELEREAFTAARDQWTAQLQSDRTAVRQAEVDLADAGIKLRRAQKLAAEGIVTAEALETSELAETSARLRLDQSKDAVRRSQANLDKARDDYAKTTIYAPLTGRVIELNAEEGEVVVSGTMNNPASVIGTIADLSELLAVVEVDETEIVDVALGQRAQVEVDAIPDHPYFGEVVEIGSSGFSTARHPDVTYFEVKVLLENADERLRAGMSARAEIETSTHRAVPVVPIQAVLERPPEEDQGASAAADRKTTDAEAADTGADNGAAEDDTDDVKMVFLVAGETAERRVVDTGIADDTHVEITRGLDGGETVIIGPYRVLRDLEDGDPVTATEPDSKGDSGGDSDDGDGDGGGSG